MIMKRSDNRQYVSARRLCNCMLKTVFCWSRWRVVLVRCLNFSLEVIDWNIRNPKLVPGAKWQTKINPYISNLFVDSDVYSVILILDTCKGIQFLYKYLIQDSIGFWVSRRGFRTPGTGFRTLSIELLSSVRFRIPWTVFDSGSQSQRFLIWPQAKISRISQFLQFRSPDSLTCGENSNNSHWILAFCADKIFLLHSFNDKILIRLKVTWPKALLSQ